MAQLAGSDEISIESDGELPDTLWSNELDHVPLIARQKMLLESKQHSDSNNPKSGRTLRSHPDDDGDEKQNSHYDSQVVFSFPGTCPTMEGRVQHLEQEKCHAGQAPAGVTSEVRYCKAAVDSESVNMCSQRAGCDQYVPGDCNCSETQLNTCSYSDQKSCAEANTADVVALEKVNASVYTLLQNSTISEVPVQLKLECYDTNLSNSLGDAIHVVAVADVPAIKVKSEVLNDFADDLDNIVLKERQRMLLQRKLLALQRTVLEGNSGAVSKDPGQHLGGKGNETICLVDGKPPSVAVNQLYDFPPRNASDLCRISRINSSNGSIAGSPLPRYHLGTESSEPKSDMKIQGTDSIRASKRKYSELNSRGGQNYAPNNTISVLSSPLSTSVKVKVEPLDNNDLHNSVENTVGNFSSNMLPMKHEQEKSDEFFDDMIDHMHLRDRMKLPMSQGYPDLNMSMNFECLRKSVPSDMQSSPSVSESVKSVSIKCRRKRKKTATDSVETALEEDAPGLLQVLIDKGVLVDEIKLYGEMESDEALDESFSEDSFSELESVISKLFSQRHSFLKFPPLRCTKSSKTRYCLACLISLVEQTRYLQFRKWPVEWGWCRDLQSFIFVFERHNRIVLERPEYGYATYFFELVNSLPIDWQIKRLVTAMKLTSCSRVALIENKALMVGEDMTEGEAQVLMQYGWLPNSGLGTMLNYCDRVVHDWKNEDISEWRSKMGKMLMNGYNGGRIVSNNIPHKFADYRGTESPEIKSEEL